MGAGRFSGPGTEEGTAAERLSPSAFKGEERPGSGRLRVTTPRNPRTGALSDMQHNGWDHALKVTASGTGLVGHAGAILLRKAADQAGLTGQLSAALRKKSTSPLLDRGIVLVSVAVSIALGATSIIDMDATLVTSYSPALGTGS